MASNFASLPGSNYPKPLDAEKEFCVLILSAFLCRLHPPGRAGHPEGATRHSFFRGLLSLNSFAEGDLRDWMKSCFGKSFADRSWDICRSRAESWLDVGVRAAEAGSSGRDGDIDCPAVLFYQGDLRPGLPRIAVFNSRKPLSFSPDAGWIEALRSFLKRVEPERLVFAASTGTLTYELAAAHAIRAGRPLVMAVPFCIPAARPNHSDLYRAAGGTVSCQLGDNCCPKSARLVCRDRILAAISQVHLVLEVHCGGNLAGVLEERQRKAPAVQFIFDPEKKNSSNAGNRLLLEKFPGFSRKFTLARQATLTAGGSRTARQTARAPVSKTEIKPSERVEWGKYLYHYTRRCPGPWPGQSRYEYLCEILDNRPLCGHSALETLARVLIERRIRGGFEMVRGRDPVVCWSSRPPVEFCALRKWNPALVRWTVEPYGVAVSRDFLRGLGAKPAVYGGDMTYRRLPEREKFRFQSNAGAVDWMSEREWRSRGDLELDGIGKDAWFAFVPDRKGIEIISDIIGPGLSVIAFNEMPSL